MVVPLIRTTRIHRTFSFFYGAAFLGFGIWTLYGLAPVLLDPAVRQAVLIDLPAQHSGISTTARIALFAAMICVGAAAAAWGVASLIRANLPETARLNGLILGQFVVVMILLEVAIRIGIVREVPLSLLTNPSYFANPVCGETFYRLVKAPGNAFSNKVYDAELGWVGQPAAGNPEGLRWPAAIDGRPKAWFFGDSFVAGVGKPDGSVPALFESANPARQSLNYGVPGYGVDQIWLRYRQKAADIAPGSPVFIGILTTDLDRSVLGYFFGPKPHFQKTETGYTLVPPPAPDAAAPDTGELIDSYALAVLRSLAELIQTGFDRSEAPCQRREKIALNRYLIGEIIAEAERRRHDLRWIVFTGHSAFTKPRNWRYDFLTGTLRERGQTFLDARETLSCAADTADIRPEAFFIPGDGHLNREGNAAVAAALADLVAGKPPACRAGR
ncbi:MAG: SGNH/GDSL hydrolase family protein [Alphaproteobacteria bacterium]